jgi:hypothetical protein
MQWDIEILLIGKNKKMETKGVLTMTQQVTYNSMVKLVSKQIQVTSQLQENVLLRAIDAEIKSLGQTIYQCDKRDFNQCLIAERASEQMEELIMLKRQLTNNKGVIVDVTV